MTLDRAQLTAYALGELKGEAAREVEELLRRDESARHFVEEARALAVFAERDLRAEPLPAGRGSAPVLAEIARRQAKRPPERRVWLQAAVIAGVIVLFTLAIPLRKQFGGSVAGLLHRHESTEVAEESGRHAPAKLDVEAPARDLAELEARDRVAVNDRFCRASLPALTAADRRGDPASTYVLGGSGLRVEVAFHARTSPLAHEGALEPVSGANPFTLLRQPGGPQTVRYYVSPERSVGLRYCELEVSTGTPANEGGETSFAAALDSLARSLAETVSIQ